MKYWIVAYCLIAAFGIGLAAGITKGESMASNEMEGVIVTSILEGRPFMFLNGHPVVVTKTVRRDRGVRYRAMMESAEVEYIKPGR